MSLTTLRVSLLALLCCTSLHAFAAQDAPAKPSQESQAPLVSVEGDAVKAEETCARGEALSKQGDARGALEALGESAKLYARVYLGARAPKPLDSPASFRSEMASRLRRAPQCLELYTRLGGASDSTDFERAQLEALRAHALGLTESDPWRVVLFAPETDTHVVITRKPEPRFPRAERGTRVSATVMLRVVLSAEGEVRHPFVLKGPHDVFSELSIEAAREIKFMPAQKGGRPVSQFVTLEYNFQSF